MFIFRRQMVFTILLTISGLVINHTTIAQQKKQATAKDTIVLPDKTIELVDVGYATRNKKDITGSVSVVDEKRIKELASVSVDALLQGQAAGVRVVNTSGAPGAGALTFIRGASTLNAGVLPLYIVDGIPVKVYRFGNSLGRNADNNPLADINPLDIASITILKDAQATAQYGMRGSNGVIVINTLGGTAGKTYLDFTGYTGVMSEPDQINVLRPNQYRSYIIEKELARGYTQQQVNNGVGRYLLLSTPANQVERYNNNTNWQDEVLKTGLLNNYHLNLRGGDAIAKYSLAVGYTNQAGVIEKSNFRRFTTRFNLDYKVGRKLSFLNTLVYSRTDKLLKDEGNTVNTNPLFLAALKSPTLTAFQQNLAGENLRDVDSADYAGRNNVYSVINKMTNKNNTNRITGKIIGQYTFSSSLNLRIGIAADYFRLDETRFRPSAGFLPEAYILRASTEGKSTELMMLNENTLNYNKTSKSLKHSVAASIGSAFQNTAQDTKFVTAINSTSDEFSSINTGDPLNIDSVISASPSWKLLSFFGNVHYTFNKKYIIGASLRADGSSRFAEGNRWGYFPSVSAAWRMSEEAFLQKSKAISDLKLRASYGVTGNQEVGYYNAYNAFVSTPYSNYSSLRFGILGNPDFTWEETKQFNAGFDAAFFSGRLGITADFYVRNTSNLYNTIKIASISGFDSYPVSEGAVKNEGIELTLSAKIFNNKSFAWQTDLNFAYNKNRILSTPDKFTPITSYSTFSSIFQSGNSVGAFYGYNAIGVYAKTSDVTLKNGADDVNPFKGGDMIFEDVNNDGIIDDKDKKVIGNVNPEVFGGFSNSVTYKGFSLDVFIDYAFGNEVYNAQRASLESMSTNDNQSWLIYQRWRKEGDITSMPRLLHGDAVGNTRFSSRWIEDGSYIRIKAITLGYNLPLTGFLKGAFKNARVFATGQNLYTFTKYKGFSPEVGSITNAVIYGVDYANLPQLKTILFGVKLGL